VIRSRVITARERQIRRFEGATAVYCNAQMTNRQLRVAEVIQYRTLDRKA
jgi:predicted ATPase with chaperone activity